MVELVNLTNHDVTVLDDNNDEIIDIPPSGDVARCKTDTKYKTSITYQASKLPLTKTRMNEVLNLPEPEDGKIYIVSLIVAAVASDRDDLVIPDELVKNDDGYVIGCRSLSFYEDDADES